MMLLFMQSVPLVVADGQPVAGLHRLFILHDNE